MTLVTRRYLVELAQPAVVTDRFRADNLRRTEFHLPGWTVRGALAAAWIRENGPPSDGDRDGFVELFEGGVRFGPAFHSMPPTSLAVLGHKYGDEEGCNTAYLDQAVMTGEPPRACRNCGQQWEQVRGIGADERPDVVRHTSVAIGPSGVAREHELFSRDRLTRGQAFIGTLHGPSELLKALGQFTQLSIGGRRTTHGLSRFSIYDTDVEPDTIETLRNPANSLVLRFVSPAILVDDEGRPSLHPSRAELESVFGSEVTDCRKWARWDQTGGWHAASGLPKHTEPMVVAGSTYRVAFKSPLDPETLKAVAVRGLGLRRHEGFGHLGTTRGIPPVPREQPGRAGFAGDQIVPLEPTGLLASAAQRVRRREHLRQAATNYNQVTDSKLREALWRHTKGDPDAGQRALELAAQSPGARGQVSRLVQGNSPAFTREILMRTEHLAREGK